jgi:hypothetical protein
MVEEKIAPGRSRTCGTGIRKTSNKKEKTLNYQPYPKFTQFSIVKFYKISERKFAQI